LHSSKKKANTASKKQQPLAVTFISKKEEISLRRNNITPTLVLGTFRINVGFRVKMIRSEQEA
jgi:hypothetical protein